MLINGNNSLFRSFARKQNNKKFNRVGGAFSDAKHRSINGDEDDHDKMCVRLTDQFNREINKSSTRGYLPGRRDYGSVLHK